MAGTRPSRSSSASKSETENGGKAKGGVMPTRKAEAEWKGNLAEGSGRLRVGSGALVGPYSWVLHDGAGSAPFARGTDADAHPHGREGEARRTVLHHPDRAGDRGRDSG